MSPVSQLAVMLSTHVVLLPSASPQPCVALIWTRARGATPPESLRLAVACPAAVACRLVGRFLKDKSKVRGDF